MTMRWMWSWFPELLRLPESVQRVKVWNDCYGRLFRQPRYWVVAAAIQVGAQLVIGIPARRYARGDDLPRGLVDFGIPVLIAVLAVLLIIWIWRRAIIRNIRRELNTLGIPTCMRCGYQLRRLPANVHHCPECGARRQ